MPRKLASTLAQEMIQANLGKDVPPVFYLQRPEAKEAPSDDAVWTHGRIALYAGPLHTAAG